MAKSLKVYEGETLLDTVEVGEDGSATAIIPNLTAGTDYTAGTYKVSFANEAGESDKVDVPAFTTLEASTEA